MPKVKFPASELWTAIHELMVPTAEGRDRLRRPCPFFDRGSEDSVFSEVGARGTETVLGVSIKFGKRTIGSTRYYLEVELTARSSQIQEILPRCFRCRSLPIVVYRCL